jgi:iron complex outermembrane receptor protein
LPSAPIDAEAEAEAENSGDIVVTARRRSETLQNTPIAISAFSSEVIQRAQVRTIQDFQALAPGLNLTGRSSTRPQQYLRGIGTDQFTNAADPAIGVFIDDVYVARASSVLTALTDIERVEVLRGPQGTLYGRNTTGGAIRVLTAEPTDNRMAIVEMGVGSFNEMIARATISGPVVGDSLTARATLFSRRDDGYLVNTRTGARGGNDNTQLAQGRIDWRPDADLLVSFGALHTVTGAGGEYAQNTGLRPTLVSPRAPNAIFSTDPFRGDFNVDSFIDRSVTQLSGRMVWTMGGAELTAITAWRRSRAQDGFDQDGSNLDIWRQNSTETSAAFSQEVRLASRDEGPLSMGGRLNWIVGAFYFDEDSNRFTTTTFGPDSVSVLLTRSRGLIAGTSYDTTLDFDIDTRSIALFGSSTLEIAEGLNITAGGRWTQDRKEAGFVGVTPAPGIVPAPANFTLRDQTAEFSSFDPKIGIDWQLSEDALLFASWSTGFRSGGFQALPTSAQLAAIAYRPESLEAWEAGFKTSWLDRRMTLNLSAFRYRYDDLQVQSIRDLGGGVLQSFVSNAARAAIEGFEAEGRYRASRNFDFGLSYAYLDARYDSFVDPPLPGLAGSRLPRAPEHQLRGDVTVGFDLGNAGRIALRTDASYFSSQFLAIGAGQIPNTTQPAYTLVNSALSFDLADTPLSITLFAKNLFDERYLGAVNFFGAPPAVQYWAPPRTFGIMLRADIE